MRRIPVIRILGGLSAAGFALALALPLAFAADAVPDYVTAAVDAPGRLPPEKASDADRKPAEVAAFSTVKPGDKVLELVPGGGYYTRVLSKIVGPTGKVYAVVPLTASAQVLYRRQQEAEVRGLPLPADDLLPMNEIENTGDYKNVVVMAPMLSQYGGHVSAPEQLDVVWSNTYHDLKNGEFGQVKAELVDAAIFAALKPGGVYMIIDGSAPGKGFDAVAFLHRSDAEAVKKEVVAAGFTFDGESKALANPVDKHSHAVWDASLRGKPDQFVLRFRKPSSASAAGKRPGKNAMDGYYGNTVTGVENTPFQRWVFYHADNTYQEWGLQNDPEDSAQAGLWYWDAMGHNCMLHQSPLEQRGFVVCHATAAGKKLGESWMEDNGAGPRAFTMLKGYVYPPK
jgi:predicted methyltransferase